MEITLEMAERLREKTGVSYAKAKEALEYSQGNLLDAMIYLEEQGEIPRPQGGFYTTRQEEPRPEESSQPPLPARSRPGAEGKKRRLKGMLRRVRGWLIDNELEVWRRDRPVTAVPVLILILLVCAAWITIPVLVVGLFFGFRYRFSGPDLDREELNRVMETVAGSAEDMGRQVMDELRAQHRKDRKDDAPKGGEQR